ERVALDVAQGPRDALLGRQAREERVEARHVGRDLGARARPGERLELLVLGAAVEAEEAKQLLLAEAPAHLAYGDLREPRAKSVALAHRADALERDRERLLDAVLGLGAAPEQARDHAADVTHVAAVDRLLGRAVTGFRALHEVRVGRARGRGIE